MSRIGLIGYGKAGRALEAPLRASSHELVFVWQRTDGPLRDVPPADVLILAVQDSLIAQTARLLGERPHAKDELWLHLSGVTPADILRQSDHLPRAYGNLHPLVALTPHTSLQGCVAGLDGDAEGMAFAESLARELGLYPVVVPAAKRALYHAAAVMVAGHATALFAKACEVMQAAGLREDESHRALQPLMLSAVENLAKQVPAQALTGPFARRDASTVEAHLNALKDQSNLADSLGLYRALGLASLSLLAPSLSQEARTTLAHLEDMLR